MSPCSYPDTAQVGAPKRNKAAKALGRSEEPPAHCCEMANYGAIGPSPAVEGSGRKVSVKVACAILRNLQPAVSF